MGTGIEVAARPLATHKDLLRIADLDHDRLAKLLDAARRFKLDPLSKLGTLVGRSVVLYFNKPSTRTRISFETAISRLGGTPIAVGSHELQLARGEAIEDTARVISCYASAFVVRTFSDDDMVRFASAASIPVINALTDRHHPCQALADVMTMQELWGDVRGRRVAYVGDGDNVAHSLVEACALMGIDVTIASPVGYEPDREIVEAARAVAFSNGSWVRVTHDPGEAVRHVDAVYTDVWLSMGVPEADRPARLREFAPYQVNSALMAHAKPDAVFMHCLPSHRGEEVTSEVIDGPGSRVFQQAANRLPTEQALLWALITGAIR